MLENRLPFGIGRSNGSENNQQVDLLDGKVSGLRFESGVPSSDREVEQILHWIDDPETKRHLDPLPRIPNWENPQDVQKAVEELRQYYYNIQTDAEQRSFSPKNIHILKAYNDSDELLGILTVRWRGDKFLPRSSGIASIERLVVDPNLQSRTMDKVNHKRLHVGKNLLSRAVDYAFNEYDGYNGQGAKEVRAWIMTDKQAGDFLPNIHLMQDLGFQLLPGDHAAWSRHAEKRGIVTDREAYQYQLTRPRWEAKKPNHAPIETPTA